MGIVPTVNYKALKNHHNIGRNLSSATTCIRILLLILYIAYMLIDPIALEGEEMF